MTLVPVTQQHIDEGIAGDCTACPVASALNDAGLHPISVQPSEINLGDDDEPEIHYTSAKIADWMFLFDDGKDMEPMTMVVYDDTVCTLPEYQRDLREYQGAASGATG